MTSELPPSPEEAFVWIWLPGMVEPVVAGRISRERSVYAFNYGRSYLERKDASGPVIGGVNPPAGATASLNALPIFLPELPLVRGALLPEAPLTMAGCLRDGAPDAWGRRVIIHRLTGLRGRAVRDVEFDELTYLLHSGSDRAGALDFQGSATTYLPRRADDATLEELAHAAGRVERGEPIPDSLERALFHGTSIGGARPKAVIDDGPRKLIAKFSASSDTHSVVKAEYVAMRLAARVGIQVAPVELAQAGGKDVLLVERFDRASTPSGWCRRMMVSALTLFGLDEMQARYASYADLAEMIRARFTEPQATLRELYARLVFNVLVGNTDDHARNHAAFWDGAQLTLTPAYDICPQSRSGRESNQAMLIDGADRSSRLEICRLSANRYLLSDMEAKEIIDGQVQAIIDAWREVCDQAQLSEVDRAFLWRRQFLNDFAFEGYAGARPTGLD